MPVLLYESSKGLRPVLQDCFLPITKKALACESPSPDERKAVQSFFVLRSQYIVRCTRPGVHFCTVMNIFARRKPSAGRIQWRRHS